MEKNSVLNRPGLNRYIFFYSIYYFEICRIYSSVVECIIYKRDLSFLCLCKERVLSFFHCYVTLCCFIVCFNTLIIIAKLCLIS